ncbi:MAG: selenocysteine-specific translation elongation factor [Acidobacteria bacterium]|nr:selenocysteine-specific translation elongation factor [Acidobacteriota bacterium]
MKNIIFATAGHIDHGKSALIRILTGTDTDRLVEEKKRGITIDLGYANITLDDTRIHFIDVPGHEKFIRNMLAGAGTVQALLLVIAANSGIMPQTVEHFEIARLLGIQHGIIAITKTDLSPSADTTEEMIKGVKEFIKGSFLENAPIVKISSLSQTGFDVLKRALIDIASEIPELSTEGYFRMPIDRSFSIKGYGTVVTGSVINGYIGKNDRVEKLPGKEKYTIRNIQVFGNMTDRASAGQRAALNMQGSSVEDFKRGDIFTNPDCFDVSDIFDAEVEFLGRVDKLIGKDRRIKFYHLSREIRGKIKLIGDNNLIRGETGFARIALDEPAFLLPGDRFILRRETPIETIGGGIVLFTGKVKRDRNLLDEYYKKFQLQDLNYILISHLNEKGADGLKINEIRSRTGLDIDLIKNIFFKLQREDKIISIQESDKYYSSDVISKLQKKLKIYLKNQFQLSSQPIEIGSLKKQIAPLISEELLKHILNKLEENGEIKLEDFLIIPASSATEFTDKKKTLELILEEFLLSSGFTPPKRIDIPQLLGHDKQDIEIALKNLLNNKKAVKISREYIISALKITEVISSLQDLADSDRIIEINAIKEKFNISRKYTIPLLEYLDTNGYTRRLPDGKRQLL